MVFQLRPFRNGSASDKPSKIYDDDENKERGNWSKKIDFMLSLIGYCVGFGNVWRFPYLCYRNGGGAFLVPYFLMLAIAGIPMYFLELAIGQYASLGPVGVWNLAPLFKGIGIAAVLVTGVVNIYYNTLLTYVFYYLFASMTSVLPWMTCDNEWNTPACRARSNQALANTTWFNETANGTQRTQATAGSILYESLDNLTSLNVSLRPKTPTEEYFENHVLNISSGIDELGSFRWQLLLCSILSWVIVYLCLMKGIKSSGKVVYVTATFPYIVLTILLIRGLTLEGSMMGVRYYLIPEWNRLLEPKVWGDAAAQIFYSLGPGWGCLITFASYNKFHNNCQRDAVVASIICCCTSVYAGLVIFTVIGFMAHELQMPISTVMSSGPGLAFIAYPEALSRMPVAPFWAILFFAMLVTTGLDSMFAQIEVIVSTLSDSFPKQLRNRKALFSLGVIFVYFLVGLPQMTQGGIYIITLLDSYIATFSIVIIAFMEAVVVVYIYGYANISKNIELMIGQQPSIYFKFCWMFLTPAITFLIVIFNAAIHTPATYNEYVFPEWAQMVGWLFGLLSVSAIPGYAIFHTYKHFASTKNFCTALRCRWTGETLGELVKPSPEWGPMLPQFRYEAGLQISESEKQELEASGKLVKTDIFQTTQLQRVELGKL